MIYVLLAVLLMLYLETQDQKTPPPYQGKVCVSCAILRLFIVNF